MKVLPALPLVLAAAAADWFVLAQSGALDPSLTSLVGNLGVMGALLWHMWYHTTRSYPQMQDKHNAALVALQATFKESQDKHDVALIRLQETFTKALEKVATTFDQEQSGSRAEARADNKELRDALLQTMAAHRSAVHDVRDTAQVTMNKVALAMTRQQEAPP